MRLIWRREITKAETCQRASLYFSSQDYLIWFTLMNNLHGCQLHHSDTLREDMINHFDHRRLIWKREITKAETCQRASLYFASLDSLIQLTFMNNLKGCSLHHSDTLREDMMNDCDHRRLIWKREITKAETQLRASLYFCSLESLIWFTFINNLQECPLCHSDIIREDMLNDCDHKRLLWKRELTKAETFLRASLYFSSLDSLIWFKSIINLQGWSFCHSDMLI